MPSGCTVDGDTVVTVAVGKVLFGPPDDSRLLTGASTTSSSSSLITGSFGAVEIEPLF